MSARNIEKALLTSWVAFAGDSNTYIDTAYENDNFEPINGTPWAQVFFLPEQPKAVTLSGTGEDEHTGIFQINLNYPKSAGAGAASDMAALIFEHYQAGARFAFSGQEVLVLSCGRAGGRNDGDWYIVPITIDFLSRTARSL
jgi:hypothetical protein